MSFHRALGACPSPTAECIIVVLVLSALWLSSIHFHAYVARNHPATSRLHTAASLLLRFCCLITASYIVPATDEIRKRAGVIVCVRMSGSFLHPFGNKKKKKSKSLHFLLLFHIFYFLLLCYSECLCLPSLGCCLLALRIPLFYFVNCLRCIPFDERLLDILNFVSTKDTATKVVYIYSCGSSVKYSTMAWKRATFVLFCFCPICKQIRDRKSESKRMADEGGGDTMMMVLATSRLSLHLPPSHACGMPIKKQHTAATAAAVAA